MILKNKLYKELGGKGGCRNAVVCVKCLYTVYTLVLKYYKQVSSYPPLLVCP